MSENTPTLREELDRKLIDYLANRESRRLRGELSASVIGIEAGALWDVLAGLANDDTLSLLSQLETLAKREQPATVKRYFMNDKGVVLTISYQPAQPGWAMGQCRPQFQAVTGSTAETGDLRKARIEQLAATLLANQYLEI